MSQGTVPHSASCARQQAVVACPPDPVTSHCAVICCQGERRAEAGQSIWEGSRGSAPVVAALLSRHHPMLEKERTPSLLSRVGLKVPSWGEIVMVPTLQAV